MSKYSWNEEQQMNLSELERENVLQTEMDIEEPMEEIKEKKSFWGAFQDALRGVSRYVILSSIILVIGCILGYVLYLKKGEIDLDLYSGLGYVKEIAGEIAGKSLLYQIGYVFWNNLRVSLIFLFAGMVLFLVPMLGLTVNGMIIGVLLGVIYDGGQGFLTFLAGILPHGIFEIPALLLCSALGIKFSFNLIFGEKNKTRKESFRNNWTYLKYILPFAALLLLLAAAIEMGVTGRIMEYFL